MKGRHEKACKDLGNCLEMEADSTLSLRPIPSATKLGAAITPPTPYCMVIELGPNGSVEPVRIYN